MDFGYTVAQYLPLAYHALCYIHAAHSYKGIAMYLSAADNYWVAVNIITIVRVMRKPGSGIRWFRFHS